MTARRGASKIPGLVPHILLNLLRHVYPLRLRALLFHRLGFCIARPDGPATLEFAGVSLRTLSQTDVAHRQIACLGFYELGLSRRIVKLAAKGGLLVDVGANVGYFSCLWAAVNSANRAIAFEASPRMAPVLRDNVEGAGLREQIAVMPFALGQETGKKFFDLGPEEQTGWGGLMLKEGPRSVEVEVKRLDEVCGDFCEISVLKIDTEGADTWVLLGAAKLLREKRIRHVFYENNYERMNALGIEGGEAASLLSGCGYRIQDLGRLGSEIHAYI